VLRFPFTGSKGPKPWRGQFILTRYALQRSHSVTLCGLPLCGWVVVSPRCFHFTIISSVKYFSKNTLKYYLSSFLGCLYFNVFISPNFYFTTFLNKIMYFLLHTFSLTPKSTLYILTGKLSNSHTYQENIPGHPYCLWSGGVTKHKYFVCKLCLSVGVPLAICQYK
jgi:hypothetical protein